MKVLNISFLFAAVLFHFVARAQDGNPPTTLTVKGEVANPLTLHPQDLARMKRITVRVIDRDEKSHSFSGIAVADILQEAGAPMGTQLRGKNMTKYLLVRSKDGYLTVFTLAELDTAFTDRIILLADQVDGQPLAPDNGPFRIIVPGEKKHARWTWGVTTFIVQTAKE